jgi:hypothetical protein
MVEDFAELFVGSRLPLVTLYFCAPPLSTRMSWQ